VISNRDFPALHSLLCSIAEERIGRTLPLPAVVEDLLRNPDGTGAEISASVAAWLELLDHCATPALVRTAVQDIQPEEFLLAAFLQYVCVKPQHSDADRERVDWLMSYLFKMRVAARGAAGDVEAQLRSLVWGLSSEPLSEAAEKLLRDLGKVLVEMSGFTSFQTMNQSGITGRGREIKRQLGEEFYHPRVLAAVVNYNLIFGKQFDALLMAATSRMKKFGAMLVKKDYHYAASDFATLVDDAAPPAMATAAAAGAAPAAFVPPEQEEIEVEANLVEQQMREMGLDPAGESRKLKLILMRMSQAVRKAGSAVIKGIPLKDCECPVTEWEVRALASAFDDDDNSFRAEFSRQVQRAVAIRAAAAEEWMVYELKKDTTDYLWKAHYDALVWLLFEGRQTSENLVRFARQTKERGLPDRAEQILKTAAKLDETLAQLAKIF
jgi:hypothetical protein